MTALIMKTRLSVITIVALACWLAFPTRVPGQGSEDSRRTPAGTPGLAGTSDPFKLNSAPNPGPSAIDPATGLPAANAGQPAIDPTTGLPMNGIDPMRAGKTFGYGGGIGGGGFGGVGSSPWRTGPSQTGVSLTFFEAPPPKTSDEIAEDMQTLSFLLARNLERAFADDSSDYKLGIPMLLGGEGRSVEASYIEGFGEVFKMSVRFPLVGPAREEPATSKPRQSSEWEEARRAVSGSQGPFGVGTGTWDVNRFPASEPYDPKLVSTLKQKILETLKNASNLRHLGPDDWIVVTVNGAPNLVPGVHKANQPGASPADEAFAARYGLARSAGEPDAVRPTIMTLRIRMSSAQGYASEKFSDEQFAKQAHVTTYLGPLSPNYRLFGSYSQGGAKGK